MKRLLPFALLAAVTLTAQTVHKKNTEPPEVIPHSAVEPVTADSKPSCPRDDYELKWFIEESATTFSTGWIATGNSCSSGCCNNYCVTSPTAATSTHVQGTLYFKPMCIKKEAGTAADGN